MVKKIIIEMNMPRSINVNIHLKRDLFPVSDHETETTDFEFKHYIIQNSNNLMLNLYLQPLVIVTIPQLIVKILNLYVILLCTQLYHHFFPVSIQYLQCINCLLHYI